MTAIFQVLNGKTTVQFAYTALTEKVVETVKACVKNIYPKENDFGVEQITPFEELTNQQILDYLDQYILDMIIQKAKDQLRVEMMDAAMATASVDIETEIKAKFIGGI